MATSDATPADLPDDVPADSPDGAPDADADAVDPVAAAISAVIDPLIENEKAIAAGYAERARLLAELDQLGHDPQIIAGLCGDPIESGRNDPDTEESHRYRHQFGPRHRHGPKPTGLPRSEPPLARSAPVH